jgi:hypothetical protein
MRVGLFVGGAAPKPPPRALPLEPARGVTPLDPQLERETWLYGNGYTCPQGVHEEMF